MVQFCREASVPYPVETMYALVNDVAAYPEFLPWCSGAQVLEQSEMEMLAKIEVSAAGMHKSFTTRNHLIPNESIKMHHVDGPFKSLTGLWEFHSEGKGCRVTLDLSFEIASGIKSTLFGLFFNKAAEKLVQAFCDRAHQLSRLSQ